MSGFLTPSSPNLADFLTFLATSVQIPLSALPTGSPWPQYALDHAIALALLPSCLPSPVMYTLAVYNGATHVLLAITPDQPGQTYFANARAEAGFGIALPSSGVVSGASDQGTSGSLVQPEWAKGLTISQLQFFKTPWGRELLSWNQSYGPAAWGLT